MLRNPSNRTLRILLVLLLGLPGMALGDEPPAFPSQEADDPALVTVNGAPITVSRFRHSYLLYLLRTGRNDTEGNRRAHLDNLVATFLLADEARRRGYDRQEAFREFENRQTRLAVGARYFQSAVTDSLGPLPEEEVRQVFRYSKERVAVRHLFFRDPGEARTAYQRLMGGEDFLTLANEVFDTPALDSTAGYLGYATYFELDDAVGPVAFSLAPGAVSEPVRSRFGWHILRVEDRLSNPILSESEFQTRRSGLEAQARVRRNRRLGDDFVRRLMEGLGVTPDADGLRLASEAIGDVIRQKTDEQPQPLLRSDEVALIRSAIEPSTVLMTYLLDGQRRTFTGLDFYRWLPELSYVELRDRPLAAVGRALRNEVLALKGFAAGFGDDEGARETVRFVSNTYLARRLLDDLEALDPAGVEAARVEEAFTQLGYRTLREARADWWQIGPFPPAEADTVLRGIRDAHHTPSSYPSYSVHADADLHEAPLGPYLRRAPTGYPVLLCAAASECHVVQVEDIRLDYTTLEESEDQIRGVLARYLPEAELLARLRENAKIDADDALIEQTMKPE